MNPRPANPLAPYLALGGLWLLLIVAVPPRANFPLNDDWIYAKVVQHLAETGRYEANPYGDPTFILQAYWGAAFVKLFGFGFDTLRLSTLVLGLVAVWSACWCAIEAGLSRRWAFLCGLTLLVNPLFINLSYTFMTDVPLIALSTLAIGGFIRALRTGRLHWIWIGNAAAVAAFFVRQFGVLVPIAFAVSVLIHPPAPIRARPWRALAAFSVPWVIAAVLLRVLPVGGEGLGADWDWSDLGHSFADRGLTVAKFLAAASLYLALFCAPVLVAARATAANRLPIKFERWHAAVVVIAGAIGLLLWNERYSRPPRFGNMLYDLGVGPLLLSWMLEDGVPTTPMRLGGAVWAGVNVMLALAVGLVLLSIGARIARALRMRGKSEDADFVVIDLFLALSAAAFVVVLILPAVANRFDRYFLGALVPVVVLIARALVGGHRHEPGRAPVALAAVYYLFGIACLQDYLAWNGARWTAAATLQTKYDAPLAEIDGGYEFNGWHHSDAFVDESRARGVKVFGPKGWWTLGDDFRIHGAGRSGAVPAGSVLDVRYVGPYTVLEPQPYFSWLGFKRRELLLLRRAAQPESESGDPAQ